MMAGHHLHSLVRKKITMEANIDDNSARILKELGRSDGYNLKYIDCLDVMRLMENSTKYGF